LCLNLEAVFCMFAVGFMVAVSIKVGQAIGAGDAELAKRVAALGILTAGAFAVIIAIARKTRSAEITSLGGLFSYMPGLTVAMTIFLASLTGIPPLGGWYAKFSVWSALVGGATWLGYAMAVVMALNTVIAAYYYLNVAKTMWFDPVPDGDSTPVKIPVGLTGAIALAVVATLVLGIFPGLVTDISNFAPGIEALGN
jgi:NADH-quinone oxidoreductase subunit N